MLAVVPVTSAGAITWLPKLCIGFSGCNNAGMGNAGYQNEYTASHWGMFGGHNCTNYTAYRLIHNGIDASYLSGQGMAWQWGGVAASHGVAVDGNPRVGDIAWFSATSGIGSDGHVAYVEAVAGGRVTVSEDNWGGDFDWRQYNTSEVTGFIHFAGAAPGSPFGSVDGAVGIGGGGVFVRGWVLDPDTTSPIELHVYVDGVPGSGARGVSLGLARMNRPDVDAVHHKGAAHGFSTGFMGLPAGGHNLYFYGINVAGTPGDNPLFGQATINVPAVAAGSPFGNGESATGDLGGVRLAGWGIDPDSPTSPITIHAYLDGPAGTDYRGFDLGLAQVPRGDVASAFPGAGPNHGLDTTIAVEPGPHSMFLYAINRAGGGENPLIGVQNFDVPSGSPTGSLDAASGGDRAIKLRGWAIDPDDATGGITIHAYVDGPAGQGSGHDLGAATVSRGDVAAAHPAAGAAHGFEVAIPGVAVGSHGVWVYALDRKAPGENVLIGQATVSVGAAPASPAAPGAVPGDSAVTVSWTAPDSGTSPITGYQVQASPGGATCSTGPGSTSCAITGLSNGTAYTFVVRAANAVGASPWSAASPAASPTAPAPPTAGGGGAGSGGTGSLPPVGGGQTVVRAPAAVTGVQVAHPAKRTAVLSWTAPANTTSYQVRVSKRNSTKKWQPWTTVTAPTVTLTKLKKKAAYRLQITPVGPGGTGATSTWKFKQKR